MHDVRTLANASRRHQQAAETVAMISFSYHVQHAITAAWDNVAGIVRDAAEAIGGLTDALGDPEDWDAMIWVETEWERLHGGVAP